MEKDTIDIHHPHDGLFKAAMKEKEVAVDFLKNRLSSRILKEIDDWGSLRLESESFVDQELRHSRGDIVYSVPMRKGETHLFFSLEQQTDMGGFHPIRLLSYNVRLMEQYIKQNKECKLPIIMNLVLYTGQRKYESAISLGEAFGAPDLLGYIYNTPFLINSYQESEEDILKDGKAALMELLLRQGHKRDFCKLLEENPKWVAMIKESSYRVQAILYILSREKHDTNKILEIINLEPDKKEEIMNALQQIEYRGREEGIQKGKKEGKKELALKLTKLGVDKKLIEKALQEEEE